MTTNQRIAAFYELGNFIKEFLFLQKQDKIEPDTKYYELLCLVNTAYQYNSWFKKESVLPALEALTKMLDKDALQNWLSAYAIDENLAPKKIGVIMAGNIAMVGFHDMLCVLIAGNIFIGKTSSHDPYLLPYLSKILVEIEPRFKEYVNFTERLTDFDAVIATGSNNSARYFDYYFGKYPHIIRKNRNSIAVLSGKETEEELTALGKDIFMYYGLGCRNVSKLYVPKGYDLGTFFRPIEEYKDIANHHKYVNNYDYNKSIYLINGVPFLDNGFVMLREMEGLASPMSVLHYEFYDDEKTLSSKLKEQADSIQCIVSNNIAGSVTFGQSQYPSLHDYADGVDTLAFNLACKLL
jgi:hypothetical protein